MDYYNDMKDLYKYIEEELATPANTMGMGNPGLNGDTMTEPLITKNITKKTSAHNINRSKDLKKKKSS